MCSEHPRLPNMEEETITLIDQLPPVSPRDQHTHTHTHNNLCIPPLIIACIILFDPEEAATTFPILFGTVKPPLFEHQPR